MWNDIETFFFFRLRGRAERSILIMNIYVNAFELKGLQIKEKLFILRRFFHAKPNNDLK